MKTWITFLLAASLSASIFATSNETAPTFSAQIGSFNPSNIHPRTINVLLGMAAEYLGISHGQARQYYRSGRIQIQQLSINADAFVEVNYDGMCILLILEDSL